MTTVVNLTNVCIFPCTCTQKDNEEENTVRCIDTRPLETFIFKCYHSCKIYIVYNLIKVAGKHLLDLRTTALTFTHKNTWHGKIRTILIFIAPALKVSVVTKVT